jgi:hypothetical protein
MNYLMAAAVSFVILCGQSEPAPMTLGDALKYVFTHKGEEFMTEEEVMALGLTRRVWCTTDRTHAGPGYAGSDQYGVERNTGKRYWLITKKKSTSCAVSSTSVPEPFEGAQAVEDPVPTIERPSIEERMMNRPQPSGSSKAD